MAGWSRRFRVVSKVSVSLALLSTLAAACAPDSDDNPFVSGPGTGSATDTETGSSSNDSSTGTTASETETGAETDTESGGVKLDVLPDGDLPPDCSGGPCQEVEFSYIWVANAPQGTVSKIDTQTLEEQGRYWTRPDLGGNPSRTSVNVSGRAVAVANRYGGVTKIWASTDDCEDQNGTPGIQTSSGKNDILAWGEDECVAWHTPLPYTTQRPIAWTAGELDPQTCEFVDEKVWVAGGSGGANGGCNGGPWMVHRLDGATGEVLDDVSVDAVNCTGTGPYGAAVDVDGALWLDSRTDQLLVRVDGETLDYSVHPIPGEIPPGGYGITADSQGAVWITMTSQFGPVGGRYDPELDQWDWVDYEAQSIGGVAEAPDGSIWMARWGTPALPGDEVVVVDRDTLEILQLIPSPDDDVVKGLSADVHGFMWIVTYSNAHRIDPETLDVLTYGGLDEPYTYSDMTGAALVGAACGPVG